MSSSNTIPVTSPSAGFAAFSVEHGLPSPPTSVQITMTGPGVIWLNNAQPPDGMYIYLGASDAGLTANIYAACIAPPSTGYAAYTTLGALAQMFPAWTRGAANQLPTDAEAQLIINDVASRINAVIGRRFREAMSAAGFSSVMAFSASFSTDALGFLEQLNRWGAAIELAEIFATYGNGAAAKQGARYATRFQADYNELNGEDASGKPKPDGGDFDYLFDPQAKTPTPRATMWGIAGGDQPHQTLEEEGMHSKFGRDDPRGT